MKLLIELHLRSGHINSLEYEPSSQVKAAQLLRGYPGVQDALFQYPWKHSISKVMCLVQDNKII